MISVLLASYGPQSQDYLDLCFKSLEAQTFQDFEVIHVSSGDFRPVTKIRNTKYSVFHSPERLHFPAAIAKAYEMSDPKSDTIFLLNDDVILQKDCLKTLYELQGREWLLLNPRSNCDDNGRFYITKTPFTKLQYRIDEMKEICNSVIGYQDSFPFCILRQPQSHFYATMMTRQAWKDIGGIDTNLRTGFDDRDMSHRGIKKGYIPAIAMQAYCLHGSGVTADIHLSVEDRKFNEEYFLKKHAIPPA